MTSPWDRRSIVRVALAGAGAGALGMIGSASPAHAADTSPFWISSQHGITPNNGNGDQGPAIQSFIEEATANNARALFAPGMYGGNNIRIPRDAYVGSASGLPHYSSAIKWGPVTFKPSGIGVTDPTFIIDRDANGDDASGIVIEDVGFVARGSHTAPLLHQVSGFEVYLSRVFFVGNDAAPALIIDAASNCRYDDVQIQSSGTGEMPAMMFACGGHAWDRAPSHYSNTNDFHRLRIERSANAALWIGVGGTWDTSWSEFTRFLSPHIESPRNDSTSGGGLGENTNPLVQIGSARSIDFVAPFFYGGGEAIIQHKQPDAVGGGFPTIDTGGVIVTGGTLLSRSGSGHHQADYAVRATSGNGVHLQGTRIKDVAKAGVLIESGYGPDATIDTTAVSQGDPTRGRLPLVVDQRALWKPSGAVEPPAGNDASCTVTGDDKAGSITFTSGLAETAVGSQFKILFSRDLKQVPRAITVTPRNSAAGGKVFWVSQKWGTGFQVAFSSAPSVSTVHTYDYTVTV